MRDEQHRDVYTTVSYPGYTPDMTGVPTPPLLCNDLFSPGVRSDVMLNNRTGLPMLQKETGNGGRLKGSGRREKNRTCDHGIRTQWV